MLSGSLWADEMDKASAAVANILFDFDGADQFATYSVNDDGFVDITFARNMPDRVYSAILHQLQNNPDIKGVLAGKGDPVCQVDTWRGDAAESISIPDFQ